MERTEKIIVALALMATLALAGLLPFGLISRLFQDDAFFYFAIARHFAEGLGSTFDGLHPTNGYHPLWMFILSLLHRAVPLVGEQGMRAVLVLDGILFACTLVAIAKVLAHAGLPARLRACVLLVVTAALGFANLGMEAAIWDLSFWLFALAMLRIADGSARSGDWALASVSIVACYLSRSDSILFLVPMTAVAAWSLARREGAAHAAPRAAAFLWAPLLIAGAAQVAMNIAYFGQAKTISSDLKVGPINFAFEMLQSSDGRFLQAVAHRGVFLMVLLSAASGIVLLYLARWASEVQEHWRRLLIAANLYIVMFLGAALLTLREPPRTWYYTLSMAILTVTAACLFHGWTRNRKGRAVTAAAYAATAVLCLLLGTSLLVQYAVTKRGNSLGMALWLRDHTRPDQRVFVVDGSGILKYFSERPVIDGDGLVNTLAFKQQVLERRVEQYLSDEKVDFVIANVRRESGAALPPVIRLDTAVWPMARAYVYATVSTSSAVADFSSEGLLGFVAFRTSDLQFTRPAPTAAR